MSKLERIIHDNSNGLDYILVGEIYLPLIAVPEEKREIGFYGSLHRNYLKDYKTECDRPAGCGEVWVKAQQERTDPLHFP